MALPFANTKVPVEQSAAEVVHHLARVGFQETAQVRQKDDIVVYARQGDAEFRFQANLRAVEDTLKNDMGPRKRESLDWADEDGDRARWQLKQQAERAAWRLLAEHVKGLTDSIRLGVIEVSEAFAGQLVIAKHGSKVETLAQAITQASADGTLKSPGFLGQMLIEDKR